MSNMVELPRNWPMFGYREWQTKDGRVIQYKDIDLTHLQNIMRMLARSAANHTFLANSHAGCDQGGETSMEHHFDMANRGLRQVQLLQEYIAWREENNYVFHAPKVPFDIEVTA